MWTQSATVGPNVTSYLSLQCGPFRVKATSAVGDSPYSNEAAGRCGEEGTQEENVFWTAVSPNIQVTGSSLRKVSGSNLWNAGAAASRTIASGNGYVEFTPGQTTTYRMIGLNSGPATWYYNDIEFAFHMGGDGTLHVYESGQWRQQVGTYAVEDRLSVAAEGGQIKYYRNGLLLYTSVVVPSYPLMADASLNTVNSAVFNATIGAQSFGGTPAPENVVWTSMSWNVQATGNTLRKKSGGNLWDAGAVSTRAIASGDGYVEFTVDNAVTYRMCGLSNGNGGHYYIDIDFAFYPAGGGGLHIYEGGVAVPQAWTYAPADKLRVAVEGGVVKYYKNGALLYTSTRTPVYPLLVDTSLNTVNSDVYAAVIAGTLTP